MLPEASEMLFILLEYKMHIPVLKGYACGIGCCDYLSVYLLYTAGRDKTEVGSALSKPPSLCFSRMMANSFLGLLVAGILCPTCKPFKCRLRKLHLLLRKGPEMGA